MAARPPLALTRHLPPVRESGGDAVQAPYRHDPRRPRLVPVLRRRGPGPLCGQGQVPAPPAAQLLAGLGQPPAPHGPDGGPGRPRRVGGGRERGGCADPGALADPGPPAPLQRAAQGRQELPVAGGDPRRRVAPPAGRPGPQTKGRPLLRPLRPRRGHPQHPRPPGPELPGPHLLRQQVHPPRAVGPAVPALRH